MRTLRFGDRVKEGQLLAVVWSKDLGEKKSELVDALSQLRVNRDTLTRLKSLTEGVIAQRQVREAERAVEASVVAVARAEATLRTWRVSEAEMEAVAAEATRLGKQDGRPDPNTVRRWARVELRAPLAGTILEKNVAVGDIVDTSTDLFKIADLTRLCVWAHAYEDDLPGLLALPKPIRWTVRLKADPQGAAVTGVIDKIGDLIDPNQHTALVLGRVENPDERMRAGQFITATVAEPPPTGEVEVPTTALLEDGVDSVVLVQERPDRPAYTLRHVAVTARYQDVVHLRAGGTPQGEKGDKKLAPLAPGDRVVVAGAVELKAALEDLSP
jgi:cobalt-zinc-cadmium efflux system membrane fusion protein